MDDRVAHGGLGAVPHGYIYEGFPMSFLYIFNLLFQARLVNNQKPTYLLIKTLIL